MSLRGKAAIAGFSETPSRKYTPGETSLGMFSKIGAQAIKDAGLDPKDIDGLLVHPVAGVPMLLPSALAEIMGLKVNFAESVDIGGASGPGMVWRAAAAIAAGMCKNCLCITVGCRDRKGERYDAGIDFGGPGDPTPLAEYDAPYGLAVPYVGYALIAQRYLHEYKATARQFAKVAVDQRYNAHENPLACFQGEPLTMEDVLASPMMADPIHLLEAVMPTGGGSAVVVTSADAAREMVHPPVYLRGAGEVCTHKFITYASDLTNTAIRQSADRAFEMAGIGREQIGLASIYDCFTVVVLLTLEDAGFCRKGEGGRFIEEHDLRFNGDFPVNSHGGQLSCGQSGVAGGMLQLIEAVRQLQGRAGSRQIPELEAAYVNGNGGIMSEQVSLVLGVEA